MEINLIKTRLIVIIIINIMLKLNIYQDSVMADTVPSILVIFILFIVYLALL